MNVLLSLWRESFRRVVPPAAVGVLAAVILFLAFGCGSLGATFSPVTVAQLEPDGMEGAWVEDEITHIYAAFAREASYRGGELVRVNAVQYVIPCGEDGYMALLVHSERLAEAEALLAACDRAYLGIAGEELPTLRVCGTVRAMDAASLGFYRAAAGGEREVEQSMLPYCLEVDRLNGHTPLTLWTVAVLCAALFFAGVAAVVWTVTWGGQRGLLARAGEYGALAETVERLDKLYENAGSIGNVWMEGDLVMFQSGAVSVLCRPWDIAWVYYKPFFSWRRVRICMMDGKGYTLWMDGPEAEKLMSALSVAAPGAELGWNRDIRRRYRHDRAGFLFRWEELRAGAR